MLLESRDQIYKTQHVQIPKKLSVKKSKRRKNGKSDVDNTIVQKLK